MAWEIILLTITLNFGAFWYFSAQYGVWGPTLMDQMEVFQEYLNLSKGHSRTKKERIGQKDFKKKEQFSHLYKIFAKFAFSAWYGVQVQGFAYNF